MQHHFGPYEIIEQKNQFVNHDFENILFYNILILDMTTSLYPIYTQVGR